MALLEKIKKAILDAKKSNQRRMIVISDENPEEYLLKILKDIFTISQYKRVLFATHSKKERENFLKKLVNMAKNLKFDLKIIEHKETEEIMGTTQEFLILDLTKNLRPNDLGRLMETVAGGGLIILLTPPFKDWKYSLYHETLITPPYEIKDIRNVFIPWFVRKLRGSEGRIIVEGKNIDEKLGRVKSFKKKEIDIPKYSKIDDEIYRMCLTQDQVNVLKEMEDVIDSEEFVGVLTADRGRGKSAVMGLLIANYVKYNPKTKIGITSPSPENVSTFFEFLIKGLKALGLRPRIKREEERVLKVRVKKAFVEYKKPLKILREKYDLVFVDEAAGIPITFLLRIYERFRKILFASTIHGYEGAGRSFSVRFLKRIKENPKERVVFSKMKEPIRYSEGDPIEEFLYNALLLNAEPEEIKESELREIKKGKMKFLEISSEELFKREDLLRQYVGIYILAHYRNRPNDLMLLADAPHHFPRMVLLNKKVVNAVQIAKEGGLPEEWIKRMMEGEAPSGNIIPDRIMKYYGWEEFGKEVGYRIVRIATHPSVMGKGIGSFALKELEKEARRKKLGWLGSGFGVNYELLNFWIKNGFIPVHISPERNEISGEYSIIVVKPLKEKIKKRILEINEEFRIKLLECLPELYSDMEPEVVKLLLKKFSKKKYKLDLTKSQLHRAKGYAKGIFTLETVLDVVKILSRWYFLNDFSFLNKEEERALIVKILQHNRWKFSQEILKMKKRDIRKAIRRAVKKMLERIEGK